MKAHLLPFLLPLALLVSILHPSHAQPPSLADLDTMITEGWVEDADDLLEPLVTVPNPEPRALYLKARTCLMLKNLEEAQNWGEKSVEAAPDSAEYWAQLGTIKAMRVRQSPMKALTLGRSSRKDYEKAVKLDPENITALESLLMFRLYAPGIAGGDKDKARQLADRILTFDPARGHMLKAHILRWADKDLEKARVEMSAAAAASPDDPALCYEMGRRLLAEGHRDDGLHYYRLGAERDSDPTSGQLKLAESHLRVRNLDQAEAILTEILAHKPDHSAARTNLARILLARGQAEPGIALLEDIMASDPGFAPAAFELARAILARDGDPARAAALLRGYLARNLNMFWPSRGVANWQLALALEKMKRFDEAWQHMEVALELSSGNDAMESDAKRLEFMAKD